MSAMGGKRTLPGVRHKGYSQGVKLLGALSLFGMLAACTHQAVAIDLSNIPEENYGFLSVKDGVCIPKIGVGVEPKHRAVCQRMTEPRRYRGTWYVAFETSFFTPVGMRSCIETRGLTNCAELAGSSLPWPPRWACPRKFEVEFIGRRNVMPGSFPSYRIIVDELISAKRLPDPPRHPDECDAAAS